MLTTEPTLAPSAPRGVPCVLDQRTRAARPDGQDEESRMTTMLEPDHSIPYDGCECSDPWCSGCEIGSYTVALLPRVVLRFYDNPERDPLVRAHNHLAEAMRWFDASARNARDVDAYHGVAEDQRRFGAVEMQKSLAVFRSLGARR